MSGDALVNRQRMMAQAVYALADHIDQAVAYQLTPILVADLPSPPRLGMIACVTDANPGGLMTNWADGGAGGGHENVLIWYNGTNWTVIGK